MKKSFLAFCFSALLLASCMPQWGHNSLASPTLTATSTRVPTEAASRTPVPTDVATDVAAGPTFTPTLPAEEWLSIPVVPTLSEAMRAVYQRGLEQGRDSTRFSKIGDCQNIIPYFLAPFDDPSKYRLGDQYASLQQTIDHFAGSWARASVATHGGFNAATMMSPFWTLVPRPDACAEGETPVACELRLYNPSFAIISLEEDWSGDVVKYDRYTRMLVEYILSQNIVPILGTRAELPDGEVQLNPIIVRIAYDYQVPLWNFGAAAYRLDSHGLMEDSFHLTGLGTPPYFDDPQRMKLAWPWRNLTALQAIDAIYHALNNLP
jgi:hypothetical protein